MFLLLGSALDCFDRNCIFGRSLGSDLGLRCDRSGYGNGYRSCFQCRALITQCADFCIDLVLAFGQLRNAGAELCNGLGGGLIAPAL
jgi:hypothetical protein